MNGELMTSRHYPGQGDYWPRKAYGNDDRAERYGVLMTQGYTSVETGNWVTAFLVVDLANAAKVVKTFKARGRSGDDVQQRRFEACSHADDLNFLDRVNR